MDNGIQRQDNLSAIQETLYLMKSPKNYARLLKSIENVKKGKVKSKTLIEDSLPR